MEGPCLNVNCWLAACSKVMRVKKAQYSYRVV